MSSVIEEVREAIAATLRAEADAQRAHATAHDAQDAARVASRARAQLGTGEARERMEEAISTRAIDDASHGALLEHLAAIAEQEVLARRGVSLVPLTSERVVRGDRERTLGELAHETRDPLPARAREATSAIQAWGARDRASRLEAFAEATERRVRIRARGPAMPDDAPTDLAQHCAAFLDATDDAAADLAARAHHASAERTPTLASRAAALAPLALDGCVSPRGRARRLAAVMESIGLGPELRARIDWVPSSRLAIAPSLARARGRASVLLAGVEAGIATERMCLDALMAGLAHALASPALPIEHAHAPRASAAAAMGMLFGSLLADERYLARFVDVDGAPRARIRVAASTAIVLEARQACVAVLAGPADPRSDDATRELAARALVLDPSIVPLELARSSWVTPTEAETRARATLAGLAWAPALRERYDEDFFRNPRLADFVRGGAARGGTVSAEALSAELGTDAGHAAARVLELAEGAGG